MPTNSMTRSTPETQQTQLTVVIPARNEREGIAWVIEEARKCADEVIVVDDASTDGTRQLAEKLGAKVVSNKGKKGYIGAIKTGFEKASGDIVITLDADGEHDPSDIPLLVEPILEGRVDLVLGRREKISRISERLINWLTTFKVKVSDSGVGFRAMKKELALRLDLTGKCTCGTLVLEANHHGARIAEVPITLHPIPKGRKTAWSHFWQTFYILPWLFRQTPNDSKKLNELNFISLRGGQATRQSISSPSTGQDTGEGETSMSLCEFRSISGSTDS